MNNKYSPIHKSKKVDYSNPGKYFDEAPTSSYEAREATLSKSPNDSWQTRGRDNSYASKECRVKSEMDNYNHDGEQEVQPKKGFRVPPLIFIIVIYVAYRFFTQQ